MVDSTYLYNKSNIIEIKGKEKEVPPFAFSPKF